MKKRLLTLGAVMMALSINAQFITYVGNGAQVHVKKDALVYSGGGVKTVGTGVVDNSGNVMIVGGATDKFETVAASGAKKTDGNNFILRMTDQDIATGLRYGQLYIKGLKQENITAVVDKEYKDVAHGSYQQIALPFYKKNMSELAKDLNKQINDVRWSRYEMLVWNNRAVRFDQLKVSQNTSDAAWAVVGRNANTAYYALGSKEFNASAAVKTVKGVPYADNISETLQNAGKDVKFGAKGSGLNYYRERYNTYVQDYFDFAKGPWTNNYGKNIYQFGNPFLTNLDLGLLGKTLTNIQGVRVEPKGVATGVRGATFASSAVYVMYAKGIAVGDTKNAIVKPMQTFVVKLSDNTSKTLNFDELRRFAYTPRPESTPYSVTARSQSLTGRSAFFTATDNVSSSSTVKQLAVIALDTNGEELGKTYYVVYDKAVSGQPKNSGVQVIASKDNVIGTFEESVNGGIDESLKSAYWLYINEANENDFKGKEVPLRIYNKNVKSLKFEIQENAKDITKGQERLSSGESFYVSVGNKQVAVGHENILPVVSTDVTFGLYYGKPAVKSSVVTENVERIEKPSATFVAYDKSEATYKIVFDPSWKTASIKVFDMTGRVVFAKDNVNATGKYTIALPVEGTYVVTAVSDTGEKFSQKVIK